MSLEVSRVVVYDGTEGDMRGRVGIIGSPWLFK